MKQTDVAVERDVRRRISDFFYHLGYYGACQNILSGEKGAGYAQRMLNKALNAPEIGPENHVLVMQYLDLAQYYEI